MKKGEVWRVIHQRKGKLVVRLMEDVLAKDEFIRVKIVSGKVHFISQMNNEYQEETGHGMEGSELDVRVSFLKFIERLPQMEGVMK